MAPITIGSNIASLKAQRSLGSASDALGKTFERLSSGLRINRASDDAAGLAIASTLNSNKRVFSQAIRNVNDGASYLNVAEGALNEVTNIVTRQMELAEQGANGVYSSKQRQALNAEASALTDEYNRILQSTSYNGQNVFSVSNGELRIQAGYGTQQSLAINIPAALGRAVNDGTFSAPSTVSTGTIAGNYSADLNNDGRFDIITVSTGSSVGYSYLSNGDGTFSGPISFNLGAVTTQLGGGAGTLDNNTVDFNGDGNADMLAYAGGSGFSVLLGNGDGSFKSPVSYNSSISTAVRYRMADVNNDGILDVTGSGSSTSFFVALGNGDGTFKAGRSFAVGTILRNHNLVDFNGDGNLDAVWVDGSGATGLALGNGDGTFGAITTSLFVSGAANTGAFGDFNLDGYGDIVTTNGTSIVVTLGNAAGNFNSTTTLVASGTGIIVNSFQDFDGDGFLDLAYSSTDGGGTLWMAKGNANGTFSAATSVVLGNAVNNIRDFNGDGTLDISSANSNSVSFSYGNATQTTNEKRFSLNSVSASRAALTTLQQSLSSVSSAIGKIGAYQSRLSVTLNNLQSYNENLQAAESRITDADIAQESANLLRQQILQQVSASVLAQANVQPQLALKLLRGS